MFSRRDMRIEIKRGGKGTPLAIVTFEGLPKDTFNPADFTWAPKIREVELIYQTVKKMAEFDKESELVDLTKVT